MDRLIANIRATIYYFILSICSIPFVLGSPLLWLWMPSWGWRVVYFYMHLMLFLLKWICGIDFKVEGMEDVPAGPVLYASRHESSWEVIFFNMLLDSPVCFAKREVFSYPIGGRLATLWGHIPVGRDGDLEGLQQAFEQARQVVEHGRSVLIYPSGTRSIDASVRINSGVVVLYKLLSVPCVPITLDSGRCWPSRSWAKYPGTIHVQIKAPIPPGLAKEPFFDALRAALNDRP